MERRNAESERRQTGGIISLASFLDEHGRAVNYDLMTRTRFTLDDLGGALSWGALFSFIKYSDGASAVARELGKATGWETTTQTNILLADIFDLLQAINANLCGLAQGKKPQKVKPYPRPGAENKKRHFGAKPLPPDELRAWFAQKREEKQRRRKQKGG